jgi:hypothetical protein
MPPKTSVILSSQRGFKNTKLKTFGSRKGVWVNSISHTGWIISIDKSLAGQDQ